MTEYTVTATNLALPRGARYKCRSRFPIEAGALCHLTIGRRQTIGGYYPNLAGRDCIIQPGRIIKVDDKVEVEIWGVIEPLDGDAPDRTARPGLLVAIMIIAKLYDLVAPHIA